NPCGITDRAVTSVSELVGRKVVIEEVVEALNRVWPTVFGYDHHDVQLAAFVRGQGKPRDAYLVDQLVEGGTFSPHRHSEPVLFNGLLPGEPSKPPWMRVVARMNDGYTEMKSLMRDLELNTVCEEAG